MEEVSELLYSAYTILTITIGSHILIRTITDLNKSSMCLCIPWVMCSLALRHHCGGSKSGKTCLLWKDHNYAHHFTGKMRVCNPFEQEHHVKHRFQGPLNLLSALMDSVQMEFVNSFKCARLNSRSMCLIIVGTFILFFCLHSKSEFFMQQTNGLAKINQKAASNNWRKHILAQKFNLKLHHTGHKVSPWGGSSLICVLMPSWFVFFV